jgi:hypothetical protein
VLCASHYCCRRQHTILNMKYYVYVCPVSLAELCIAERELDFACTNDGCTHGWSGLWRFLTSQQFLKITYSRSRFDFPNTLVETREHHHGLWQFVNIKHVAWQPDACCEFWFQLAANFMSGCLSKYIFTSGYLSKVFFQGKMKVQSLITNNNVFWSNYFTHWNEWIHYWNTIVYEWKIIWLLQR